MTKSTTRGGDLTPFLDAIEAKGWPDWVTWQAQPTRAKSSIISMTPRGRLIAKLAAGADPARIADHVDRNRVGLLRDARRVYDKGPDVVTKQLVSGEGFVFDGRRYRLRLVRPDGRGIGRGAIAPMTVHPGAMCADEAGPSTWSGVRTWQLTLRQDATASDVVEWYRRRGQELLDERIPPMVARLGLRPGLKWRVRPYQPTARFGGGSWATHSGATRTVAFRWQAFQMERVYVDYLLAHEVAHDLPDSRGHDQLWESAMDRLCPRWRELRPKVRGGDGMTFWLGQTEPRPAGWPYDVAAEPDADVDEWEALAAQLT